MESKWHSNVRNKVVDYLEEKGFDVRTSHKGTGRVPLYCDKVSRSSYTSDVDILVIKNGQVKYIIEIQDRIRPKDIIGIIGAINISTIYANEENTYPMKDITLFIVTKMQKKSSKKEDQARMIEERFYIIDGCLKKFVICTETDFRDRFENLS